jgi:hypothetical protein
VTPGLTPHSIDYVPETLATSRSHQVPRTAPLDRSVLTKRRAVDFCRVATAICCPPAFQPAA